MWIVGNLSFEEFDLFLTKLIFFEGGYEGGDKGLKVDFDEKEKRFLFEKE